MSKGKDLVSNNWPGGKTVTRADLSKNTATAQVKGGIKTVLSIPQSKVKGK